MEKHIKAPRYLSLIVIFFLLFMDTVSAQPSGPMGPGPGMGMGRGGGRMMMNHMKMMDQNSDGKISQQEFTAFHEKRFQQMDANGDGYVTSQEFSAGMAVRRRNMMSAPAQQGNPPRQDQEQPSPQQ